MRNVGICYDDAFDLFTFGAVGQYTADVPGTASRLDLSLDRFEGLQHRPGIGQKCHIGSQEIQFRERPADIAWNHVEEKFGRRREEPDAQINVEQDSCNIRTVQNFLQIIGGLALLLERLLKLTVEDDESFVT